MICLSCDPERLLWSPGTASSSVTVRRNTACDVLSIGEPAEFSSRVQLCGTLPQPALRCFWSVHSALILAVSYILKQNMCSVSGPAPLRPASKQWPPCGALPRALPALRIPSYAVIESRLPVQANPRITISPRRPTGGRAVHRAIGEKCCTQIRKAHRPRTFLCSATAGPNARNRTQGLTMES